MLEYSLMCVQSLTIKLAADTCFTQWTHLGKTLGQLLVDGLQGLAVTAPWGIHL
jgi:hypothetical protein